MPDDLPSKDELSAGLSREVVAPLFAALPPPWNDPGTLARPVLRNRREQARRRILDALVHRGTPHVDDDLRDLLERLVKRWVAREFEGGFADAEAFEIRCEQDRMLEEARTSGDPVRLQAAREEVHRQRVIDEYDHIEIRGLQLSERVSQDLEVAYVQLHLDDPTRAQTIELPDPEQIIETFNAAKGKKKPRKKQPGKRPAKKGSITFKAAPRLPAPEVVARHPHLLVVGAPGSGKSTLSAWITVQVARGALGASLVGCVPFVLPVRALHGEVVGVRALAMVHRIDDDFVRATLTSGRGFVVLDGLDEAPEGIEAIARQVIALLKDFPKTRVVVTSRPSMVAEGEGDPLAPLEAEGFVRATIGAMTREEVREFIGRWCLAAELSIQRDRQAAETTATMNADDLRARLRSNEAIERLAETPLMCSVLCVVHRFMGNRIPERRVALYEACTNVLLYEWDRAKFPAGSAIGRLDAPQKRALLAGLARTMHERHVAEISAAEVLSHFQTKLPELGECVQDAPRVLDEIRDRSGVLVERRRGFYGFSHMLYQEYLTAYDFLQAGVSVTLAERSEDRWWHEVIVLATGMPGAPVAELIESLLTRGGVGVILAGACVETAVMITSGLRQRVDDAVLKTLQGPPETVVQLCAASPLSLRVLRRYLKKSHRGAEELLWAGAMAAGFPVAFERSLDILHAPQAPIQLINAALFVVSAACFNPAMSEQLRSSIHRVADPSLELLQFFARHEAFSSMMRLFSSLRELLAAVEAEIRRRGISKSLPEQTTASPSEAPAPRTAKPRPRSATSRRSSARPARRRAS